MGDVLTKDTTFDTVGIGYMGLPGYVTEPLDQGVKVKYLLTKNQIEIETIGGAQFYFNNTATDPTRPFAGGGHYAMSDPNIFIDLSFDFETPSVDGVNLSYLRRGWTFSKWPANGDGFAQDFFFGFATAPSNMPKAGSAVYQVGMVGSILSNSQSNLTYVLASNSATFSVDFGAGMVSTTIAGKGTNYYDATDVIDLGTWTATGTIDSGGPGFHGAFHDGSGDYGQLAGAFFGPGAVEMGYQFYLSKGGYTAAGGVWGVKH